MIETAFVFDREGKVILWHLPPGRTGGSLPDSRDLWQVMWENRESLGGVAHTHPWSGQPWPSGTDVTTFSACERALGRRLIWPIVTFDRMTCFAWRITEMAPDGAYLPIMTGPPHFDGADLEELRRLSGKEVYVADDRPLDAPFEPDWASPPGETIQDLMSERGITLDMLASALQIEPVQVQDLLLGLMPINITLAVLLEKTLGGTKQFWINRESNYRKDLARLAAGAEDQE